MKTESAVVMVSRRCNMSCGHCSVESHPKIKTQPTEDELHALVDRLLKSGVKRIQFTGGEPMLRQELLLELMTKARDHRVPSSMVSNGFWGKKRDKVGELLEQLRSAGLRRLALSYDRYHAEFQGPQPLLNILDAAQEIGWGVHINVTRTQDEIDLADLIAPFESHPNAHLRFYDIQPVGLAKNLEDTMRAQLGGFCNSCEQATFTDNGRLIACNGPAYFEKSDSALVLGRWRGEGNIDQQLERHGDDQILETIRVLGPLALKNELEQTEGFEDYPFKSEYRGMCELCLQITSDPRAVAALQERLSTPARRAELLARRLIKERARSTYYNRFEINFRMAPLEFLKILLDSPSSESDKVLGRADLDWSEQCQRLEKAGLLSLFQQESLQARLRDWAPSYFWERVGRAAKANLEEHGLEQSLRAWYERDGVDGMGSLFELGRSEKNNCRVADSELEPFWLAARDILADDLSVGEPRNKSWVERMRYRVLRYLAFQDSASELNKVLKVLFPLLFSSLTTWPKGGLRALRRLAQAPVAFLKALPQAYREGERLGRKSI